MQIINLSPTEQIYKSAYTGPFTKEDFLIRVEQNKKISTIPNDNSVWVEFECDEFKSIDSFILNLIENKIAKEKFKYYAKHTWVYTQKKEFDLTYMHQHLILHSSTNRSIIKSNYTFTFYVKQPKNLNEDEGKIIFQTKNKELHKFLPNEMDIFIFPADMMHTAIPTPNHDEIRVVYAGNISYNFFENKNNILNLI
jgi:hypothetical protein